MMKKAKALFAAAIIVIVAGASAVCLYLNDSGKLGFGENETVTDEYGVVQDAVNENYAQNDVKSDEPSSQQAENEENEADDIKNEEKVDTESLNEFLSTFSRLYFSQDREYDCQNADNYELLRFAFLYVTVFEGRDAIVTAYFDDEIGVYNGIEAADAKRIIDKFFSISISEQSVYTEQTYQFFMYRDGYFYTPAADGVGFTDITIVDSAVKSEDMISVAFTVYSDGVTTDMTSDEAKNSGTVFAKGSAQMCVEDGEYILMSYKVDF